MRVRLFGPLRVEVDGDPVAVRGAKERGILALLAGRANGVVSTDTLIDELWGERPPPSARKSLQSYLTRLRDHLEPHRTPGVGGTRIESLNGGYRLTVGVDELDLLEFEDLVRTGHESLRAGALATAYSTLSTALGLWSGEPFHGLEGSLIAMQVSHLHELRRQAVDDRAEVALLLGRHRRVIPELEAELVTDPFREALWRQLMIALYRSGRQAEAVQAFDRARSVLLENLGLEPSKELQRTLELILNQDSSLDVPNGETTWFPAGTTGVDTVFVGRDAELSEVLSWWPPNGPAFGWLYGTSGIGKKRLAAEGALVLRRRGVPVLYGSDLPATSDPLRSLRRAFAVLDEDRIPDGAQLEKRFGEDGLMIILDDVDAIHTALAESLAAMTQQVSMPLLVLMVSEARPGQLFGSLVEDRCLELGPLTVEDVNRIVEGYVGEDGGLVGGEVYVQSGGIAALVHQIALERAHQDTESRLAVSISNMSEQHQLINATGNAVLEEIAELQDLETLERSRTDIADLERPPYRGLARYDIEDADLFFGREEEIRHLILKLVEGGVVGVVGPSGCGKSSLVRAGLASAAVRGLVPGGPWRPTVVVPGSDPVTQLKQALAERRHDSRRQLLVVDQLEQLFIACPDPLERVEFLEALARFPSEDESPAIVALLRADYYGHLSISASFSRLFEDGTMIVGPISAEQMHRCIDLPARRYGLDISPGLVSRLITECVGQPGALPLLSTTLLELWEARRGSSITISDYLRIGGVEGAVARLAEDTYRALDSERQAILKRVLLRLAGPGDSETVVARHVPIDVFGDGETAEVVRILIEDRLVTSEGETVTVAHESLFREWPRLLEWLDEDRLGREIHQHMIEAASLWERGGEREEDLYQRARLAAAMDWASNEPERLDEGEQRFLQASQDRAERVSRETEERARQAESTSRRLRRLSAAVLAVALVAAAAGVFANIQRSQARSEAEAALAASLGAQALQQDAIDLSLLLAVQARQIVDSGPTRGSLLGAVLRAPQVLGVMRSGAGRLTNVAVSPNGEFVASVSADARLDLWSTVDRTLVATFQNEGDWGPASSLAFSPTGNLVAVAEEWGRPTGAVRIWDIRSGSQTQIIELPIFSPLVVFSPDGTELLALDVEGGLHHIDPLEGRIITSEEELQAVDEGGMNLGWSRDGTTLVVSSGSEVVVRSAEGDVRLDTEGWALPSPDGSLLAVANVYGEVLIVDAGNGETIAELRGHTAPVDDLEFSPDGTLLVTSSWDGTVVVWDVATGQLIETYNGHAGRVTGVSIDRAGEVVYSSGLDGALIAWDLTGGDRFGMRPWILESRVGGAMVVAGGNEIAALSEPGVILVDTDTGTSRSLIVGDFWALGTTPAEPLVALAGEMGHVIDAVTGETIVGPIDLRSDGVGWIAVLPDGRLAVTSPAGLRVWTPGEPDPISLSTTMMWGLTASDDGSLLAGGFDDGSVGVWETDDWNEVTRIPPAGAGDPVLGLRFDPSATSLLTYAIEGPMRVWDVRTGRQTSDELTGHSGFVLDTSFSPSGASMISVGSDGKVGLWDTSTWRLAGLLPGPPATWGWGWFLDETRIVTLFEDGSTREWSADPADWETWACHVAGRSLTQKEWETFLTGRLYDPAC